ncbi:nucleoside triphosphate pyrophosphohydrolase [Bacillus suaedae]|uniref:Nucleoside triphosphate pyrophosphohydrolase n=1 Tax=Halalkalibacter suaedae TaxID=2822140 RepID=A0A940WVP2_9BACI|nr:nucleoside triphosphate pyrophosphohydrolase [Bacillus suaedae]MBP3953644.1 nucleoside triphosphate pyrophosphohydrolase [Bacillus suaedae]
MPTYNKLVRNRIPEIIKNSGKSFQTKTLDGPTYESELKTKLQEELNELLHAESRQERLEEMADLLEVVYALGKLEEIEPAELESVRKQKRAERGGFEDRILLIDVEE